MLDILALEKQFDGILFSFTEKELKQWLSFAEEREMFEKLQKGDIVTIKFNTHQVANIEPTSNTDINIAGNYQYAMAA